MTTQIVLSHMVGAGLLFRALGGERAEIRLAAEA